MKQKLFLRAECLEPRAMLSASLPNGPVVETADPVEARPAFETPASQVTPQAITLTGDFNGDSLVDAVDIDMLTANLGQQAESIYDLTTDGVVDKQDMDMLIRDIIGTEYGDADLDGYVGAWDAFVMFRGMLSGATGWASGDFSCDGIIDGQDFIEWNRFKFTQTAMQQSLAGPTGDAQPTDLASDTTEETGVSSSGSAAALSQTTQQEPSAKASLAAESQPGERQPVPVAAKPEETSARRNSSAVATRSIWSSSASHEQAPQRAEARFRGGLRPWRLLG